MWKFVNVVNITYYFKYLFYQKSCEIFYFSESILSGSKFGQRLRRVGFGINQILNIIICEFVFLVNKKQL